MLLLLSAGTAGAVALGATACVCLLPARWRVRVCPCLRCLPPPCGPAKEEEKEEEREQAVRVPAFAGRRPEVVQRPVPVPFARPATAHGARYGMTGSREEQGPDDLFYFPAPMTHSTIHQLLPEDVERQLSYTIMYRSQAQVQEDTNIGESDYLELEERWQQRPRETGVMTNTTRLYAKTNARISKSN